MSLSSALSGLNDASAAYAYENDRPARGAGTSSGGGRSKGGGGGGGGGRGKGGGHQDRSVLISKKMSYLLRHGAAKEGITMDEGGWVSVSDLLNWRTMRSMKATLAEIQEVVETNSKKRFELDRIPAVTPASAAAATVPSETNTADVLSSDDAPPPASTTNPLSEAMARLDLSSNPSSSSLSTTTKHANDTSNISTDPADFRIRAVQGHSLPIESAALLQPVDASDPQSPRYVMHGTTPSAWAKIQASGGLSKMGRAHVHTAIGTGDLEGDQRIWALIERDQHIKNNNGPNLQHNGSAEQAHIPTATKGTEAPSTSTQLEAEAEAADEKPDPKEPGPDGAAPVTVVIAGRRPTRTVLIWVNVGHSAQEGGLRWWRSNNGVILSEGNEQGMIPLRFVELVELRRKVVQGQKAKRDEWERVVIWRDGKKVEEG